MTLFVINIDSSNHLCTRFNRGPTFGCGIVGIPGDDRRRPCSLHSHKLAFKHKPFLTLLTSEPPLTVHKRRNGPVGGGDHAKSKCEIPESARVERSSAGDHFVLCFCFSESWMKHKHPVNLDLSLQLKNPNKKFCYVMQSSQLFASKSLAWGTRAN